MQLHKWDSQYQYENLLLDVLQNGTANEDRTGTGTLSLFGTRMEFNLAESFPLVTTKKVFLKGIIYELLWFLKGDTNVHWLKEHGVHIWDEWADENGDLGPVYGHQWRNCDGTDQIRNIIDTLKTNPTSRRMIVDSWNVRQINDMALPPCHCLYQFSYALLTMMIAQQTGYQPGRFIWVGGDTHIYLNHIDQVEQQLQREPRPYPHMNIDKASSIDSYQYEGFHLTGYNPYPPIKAPVAV